MEELKEQLHSKNIEIDEIVVKEATAKFEDLSRFLNEEEKKYIAAHEHICTWGDFGWTLSPELDMVFYEEVPQTQVEADQRMESRLIPEDMKKIICMFAVS